MLELASRARAWAGRLAACGIADESLVGIYLERSPEAIIAMLATLEAGGAYLPLDPSYPKERLEFMINDAGVRVLITDRKLRERLPDIGVEVLLADELPSADTSDCLLPDVCDPDRLAYVMYTSGSTGLPKAVEVTHRGVVRLVSEGLFALGEDDVELQLVSLSLIPRRLRSGVASLEAASWCCTRRAILLSRRLATRCVSTASPRPFLSPGFFRLWSTNI